MSRRLLVEASTVIRSKGRTSGSGRGRADSAASEYRDRLVQKTSGVILPWRHDQHRAFQVLSERTEKQSGPAGRHGGGGASAVCQPFGQPLECGMAAQKGQQGFQGHVGFLRLTDIWPGWAARPAAYCIPWRRAVQWAAAAEPASSVCRSLGREKRRRRAILESIAYVPPPVQVLLGWLN